MNQNHNEKFEADIRHVEEILDRTKADLKNLLPDLESFGNAITEKNGTGVETAPDAGDAQPDANGKAMPRSHFGWFHSFSHKT